MPELPEVEAVRRVLEPAMRGERFVQVIARRPDLRGPLPPQFAARLEGEAVQALTRRGKYLFAELSSNEVLVMHLGMSGSFRVEPGDASGGTGDRALADGAASSHDHVVFQMSSGVTITFNDPRRFGSMHLLSRDALSSHPTLGALGPEPLDEAFNASVLAEMCARRRTSLKAALSDQRVVAGLGNIYVCEALHRAHLSPRRRASTIATRKGDPREAAARLVAAIRKVLNEAIARSLEEPTAGCAPGDGTDSGARWRVYDRAGLCCRTRGCRGIVKRIVQGGRATFFCPVCQG